MYTLNHCKKSSFTTFGLRKKAKHQKTPNGSHRIIAEPNDLQLFKNHKPKTAEPYETFSMTPRKGYRRFMKCADNSLVLKSNQASAFNLRDKQHSQRMARDRFQAQQRRNGWLANDREPKMILGQ